MDAKAVIFFVDSDCMQYEFDKTTRSIYSQVAELKNILQEKGHDI